MSRPPLGRAEWNAQIKKANANRSHLLDNSIHIVENNSHLVFVSIASHSFGIASQQPVVPEVTMTTLPATAMAPRAAANLFRRTVAPLAGIELSVAAAAIVLWIALAAH